MELPTLIVDALLISTSRLVSVQQHCWLRLQSKVHCLSLCIKSFCNAKRQRTFWKVFTNTKQLDVNRPQQSALVGILKGKVDGKCNTIALHHDFNSSRKVRVL